MGQRYSFDLFYPVDRVEAALRATAAVANTRGRKRTGTQVRLSTGGFVIVPFTHGFKFTAEALALTADPPVRLNTVLLFPADEAVQAYHGKNAVKPVWTEEGVECLPVGFIYLTVHLG
ncbi:MAG TPA: hypothetical protein VEL76_37105, partial [Gemmataceae bacterium]|nr:hypothetical protein [Gemmataceae bacterium]